MITNELLLYLQRQFDRGVPADAIKKALNETGWEEKDIKRAFEIFAEEGTPSAVHVPQSAAFSQKTPVQKTQEAPHEIHPRVVRPAPPKTHENLSAGRTLLSPRVKKILRFSAISLLVGGVLGGGLYAYITFFTKTPSAILEEAAVAHESVSSWRSDLTLEGSLTLSLAHEEAFPRAKEQLTGVIATLLLAQAPAATTTLDSSFPGEFQAKPQETDLSYTVELRTWRNVSDAENPQGEGSLSVALDSNTNILFSNVSLIMDIKFVDNTAYVKLNEIVSPFLSSVGMDVAFVEEIKGRWISLPFASSSLQNIGVYRGDTTTLEEQAEELEKRRDALALFRQSQTYKNFTRESLSRLRDARIDGVQNYHLRLKADKESWEKLIAALHELLVMNEVELEQEANITSGSSPERSDMLSRILAKTTFDFYIGKKDMLLRKFEARSEISNQDIGGTILDGTLSTTGVFSDYNEDTKVHAPEESVPYDTVIKGTLLENKLQRTRDAKRVTDIRQLQIPLELYYDDKRRYPRRLQNLEGDYISELPKDPLGGEGPCRPHYCYAYPGDRQTYHLGATLEVPQNSLLQNDADFNSEARGFSGDAFDGNDENIILDFVALTDESANLEIIISP